jgi:hypothetical protein
MVYPPVKLVARIRFSSPGVLLGHCQRKLHFDHADVILYCFGMKNHNPFRYFKTSPEVTRLAVMMYVRYPLSLRNVEDILHQRAINIFHEIIRYWWNRFGLIFAREIRKKRIHPSPNYSN